MRRYVITMTVALMMIAPLVISKLGYSHAEEKPTQTQEKPKGNVEAGKALYMVQCKRCHSTDGVPVDKIYRMLKANKVQLGSKVAQDKSDDFIRKSMTDGCCKPTNKMQAIKELTSEQIEDLLAFTRTLKQEESSKK